MTESTDIKQLNGAVSTEEQPVQEAAVQNNMNTQDNINENVKTETNVFFQDGYGEFQNTPQTVNSNSSIQPVSASFKKKETEFDIHESILAAVITVLAIVFVRLVLYVDKGIFATLFYAAFITTEIVYFKKKKFEFSSFNKLTAFVMYAFSTVFTITDNTFIKFLDLIFLFSGTSYLAYSVGAGKDKIERFLPFALLKSVFEYPFSKFDTYFSVSSESLKKTKSGSNIKLIIIGLILGVPLTLIVGSLLMEADDGMKNIINSIFSLDFMSDLFSWIWYLIIAIPLAAYIFGLLYRNVYRKDINEVSEEKCLESLNGLKFINNLVLYTAVTPVIILYIIFFISQTSYFLSAFSGTLPEEFSYAVYARKGFFELCFVAVINFAVIVFMNFTAKKCGNDKTSALKAYTIILSVSTLILLAVAMSKMVMYISAYGLTQLRVYTTWFMLLCAFFFILIIVKQFKTDFSMTKSIAVGFTLMFAVLCFSRPDAVIAKYNIDMYNNEKRAVLDESEIISLSDDSLLVAVDNGIISLDEAKEKSRINHDGDKLDGLNISTIILNSK